MTSEEILARLRLDGPYDQRVYVETVKRRFGRKGERFLDAIDRAIAIPESSRLIERAYALQNAVPELSHYVAAHANPLLYKAMLDWLRRWHDRRPSSVLEVGCGNGLFTCCLALLWPGAQVTGIDVMAEAVRTAKILAARLEVPYVKFAKMDLAGNRPAGVARHELIVAPFVFHHLLEAGPERWPNIGRNIADVIEPGGRLISIDRFPNAADERRSLIGNLAPSGLDPIHQDILRVGAESFPVTAFAQSVRSTVPSAT